MKKYIIVIMSIKKHEDKKFFPNRYAGFTYNSSLSAILKVMESQNLLDSRIINNNDFHNLVERGMSNNKELETEILNKAKEFTTK